MRKVENLTELAEHCVQLRSSYVVIASDPEAPKEQHSSGSLKADLIKRFNFNHAHNLFLGVSLDVT